MVHLVSHYVFHSFLTGSYSAVETSPSLSSASYPFRTPATISVWLSCSPATCQVIFLCAPMTSLSEVPGQWITLRIGLSVRAWWSATTTVWFCRLGSFRQWKIPTATTKVGVLVRVKSTGESQCNSSKNGLLTFWKAFQNLEATPSTGKKMICSANSTVLFSRCGA